jgi:hypothetical protein
MKNKTVKVICTIIYSLTVIIGFIFAAMYLFRPEFMPYHEVAIGKPWAEINIEYRVLILALMRVSGGGWLATSVGMLLLLLFPLRKGYYWSYIGIPAIGLSALVPTLIAILHVKSNSNATPPYILAVILIGLLITTIILSLIYKKRA